MIGINTAIASNNGGYQGIGFAIPSNQAKWVTQQLVERGSVERGYLGVQIGEVTLNWVQHFSGYRPGQGVVVTEVLPKSPAAEAGLQEYDVIVAFNGAPIRGLHKLQEAVEQTPLGQRRPLTVLRNGKDKLDLVVKALPQSEASRRAMAMTPRKSRPTKARTAIKSWGSTSPTCRAPKLEIRWPTRRGYQAHQGRIAPQREGLRPGMLIRSVGRTPVKTIEDYAEAIQKNLGERGVLLSVRAGGGNRLVVINPDE